MSPKRTPKWRRPRNPFSSRLSLRTITQSEFDSLICPLKGLSDLAMQILANGPATENNPMLRAFLAAYPFFQLVNNRNNQLFFMINMRALLQFMGRDSCLDGITFRWDENLCPTDLSGILIVQETKIAGDFFHSRFKPRSPLKYPHSHKRGILVDENFRATASQKTFVEEASHMAAESQHSIMRFFPPDPAPALNLTRLHKQRHTEKLYEIENILNNQNGMVP